MCVLHYCGPCFWKLLNYNFKRANVKIIARKFSQLRDDENFHFNIFSIPPHLRETVSVKFLRNNYESKLFHLYIHMYMFNSRKSATRKTFSRLFYAQLQRDTGSTGTVSTVLELPRYPCRVSMRHTRITRASAIEISKMKTKIAPSPIAFEPFWNCPGIARALR